jgi:DNA recombination protein RmuC
VGFTEDLVKVGQRLSQAQTEYEGAFGKLSSGRGNLIRQAEQLRELGVKVKKALPVEIADDAITPADASEAMVVDNN